MYSHFEPHEQNYTNDLLESKADTKDIRVKSDELEQKQYLNEIADNLNNLVELNEQERNADNNEKINSLIYKIKGLVQIVDEFPSNFFPETEFFQKISTLINSDSLDLSNRKDLLNLLIYLMKSNSYYVELFATTCDPFQIFATAFDNEEKDYFSVACNFFKICFDYNELTSHLLDISFLEHFFDVFNEMISSLSEYELNLPLNDGIISASELFLIFVQKLNQEILKSYLPIILETCSHMLSCPIFYLLAEYTSEIMYTIGQKYGFLSLLENDLLKSSISLLSDLRCRSGFNYIIMSINGILEEDKENNISPDSFPLDLIINLLHLFYPLPPKLDETNDEEESNYIEIDVGYQEQIEDDDLLSNILKLLLVLAKQGPSYFEHLTEGNRINDIINIYNNSNYKIRLQCIEYLWSLLLNSDKDQALDLVENKEISEIVIEAVSGDNIDFSERVIDDYIGPFIDSIVQGGPFEYYRFNDFLFSLKQAIDDLGELETETLTELIQRLDELLQSIPIKPKT